jgi:hypothetical protein
MSTSPPLEEEPMPLNIVIVSYSTIGKASMELLKHDPYLGIENEKTCHVTWIDLDLAEHRQTADACAARADIVVILGDNTSGEPALTAGNMATRCKEANAPCYVLISQLIEQEKQHPSLIDLIKQASNTLLISQDTAPKTSLPKYLASAVLNVLHPITGVGLICVDLADIRTILSCGKKSVFALTEASGEHRSELSAHAAVAQLTEISTASSMLCNITSGFDLRMEEIALIGDIVRDAAPDDCVVVCTATLISDCEEGWMQVGITAVF